MPWRMDASMASAIAKCDGGAQVGTRQVGGLERALGGRSVAASDDEAGSAVWEAVDSDVDARVDDAPPQECLDASSERRSLKALARVGLDRVTER